MWFAVGALPRVCQPVDFCENVCQDSHSLRVWVERGRASAIQAIHGMALAGLKAQHASSKQLWQGSQRSRRACSFRHVPGSTGKQDSNDGAGCSSCFTFLSKCSKDCGANTTFFQCATCDGANTLPKWQREPTGLALLAGDEGEPFAQEDPLCDSEEVHNSKRDPTHRGGIVRRAPREKFGAKKSRGTQWLLHMSHCKASFSVACAKLGAFQ